MIKLLLTIASGIVWGSIFLILSSCGSPVQKVLTNKEYFSQVGHKWAELNPCTPADTVMEFIKGDSVILTNMDTIVCMRVFRDTVIVEKLITKTVKKTDIVVKTVTDTRALKIANESISTLQAQLSASEAKAKELSKQVIERTKWLYIGALFLFIIGIVLGIILRFKL